MIVKSAVGEKEGQRESRGRRLKTGLALLACRISGAVLRRLGRGGTSLPGRIALAVDPEILSVLAGDVRVTLVTGTNGKTTTCRMIDQAFRDAGLSCFSNRSGANLLPGITAEFAAHSSLRGRCRHSHAVIECDEAAFLQVIRFLSPACLLVTNLLRDQTERLGEASDTARLLREGIARIPDTVLCLNADCPLTASLASEVSNRVIWYGVNIPADPEGVQDQEDTLCCDRCGFPYLYQYRTYSHLGGYRCPVCGRGRPAPQVAVTEIREMEEQFSDVIIQVENKWYPAQIHLPEIHNIYNGAAAVAAGRAAGISSLASLGALSRFPCAEGRGNETAVGKARVRLLLAKNPAGLNLMLRQILRNEGSCRLVFLLNDLPADGTDIRWIQEADLEALSARQHRFSRILLSGLRRKAMKARLLEAGFEKTRLEEIRTCRKLLRALGAEEGPVFLLANYTAMFRLLCRLRRRRR